MRPSWFGSWVKLYSALLNGTAWAVREDGLRSAVPELADITRNL